MSDLENRRKLMVVDTGDGRGRLVPLTSHGGRQEWIAIPTPIKTDGGGRKFIRKTDDNDDEVFVFTKDGPAVPMDVIRLRVDPSIHIVPQDAVNGRTKLIELELCNGIEEIDQRAFANCTALTQVKIPASVKILHEGAFEYCTSLKEVELREGIKEIRDYAFRGCTSLEYVNNYGTEMRLVMKEELTPTEAERDRLGVSAGVKISKCYNYQVGSEVALKPMFTAFANERGTNLRSLRLSYKGKRMFISSVWNKCPKELNMQDEDVIHVVVSEEDKVVTKSTQQQTPKVTTQKKKKQVGKKSKAKKKPVPKEEIVMTTEDYKTQHSLAFTKVFEELQPRLKEIRTELNALDLQCQPKKMKNSIKKSSDVAVGHTLPGPEIGGKAGKSHFVIQVGEVQNLYKSTKASSTSSLIVSQGGVPTLDLHGCTKEDAIVKLNESLEVWFEIAMTGSYPFVITAVIVCGCGSQVLSETVQDWIKSTSRVRNAPKNHIA
jgi:hypothetical protein